MNASGQLFVFIYLTALEKKLLVKFSDGFKGENLMKTGTLVPKIIH